MVSAALCCGVALPSANFLSPAPPSPPLCLPLLPCSPSLPSPTTPPAARPPAGRLGEHRVEPQQQQVLGERAPRERPERGLGPQPRRRRRHHRPRCAQPRPTRPQGSRALDLGPGVEEAGRGQPDISRLTATRSAARHPHCCARRAPPHTFPRSLAVHRPPQAPLRIGAPQGGAGRGLCADVSRPPPDPFPQGSAPAHARASAPTERSPIGAPPFRRGV